MRCGGCFPIVFLVVAGCGGGPQVRVDPRIKRDFTVTLASEKAELTGFVDGTEHLHAGPGRGATLAAQLREGEHTFMFRARQLEYEGMALNINVSTDGGRAFEIVCNAPCNGDALRTVADNANSERELLSQRCADVEVKSVTAATTVDANNAPSHEVTVTVFVKPPQSPEQRAARGCKT